jgi:hypothetical protein
LDDRPGCRDTYERLCNQFLRFLSQVVCMPEVGDGWPTHGAFIKELDDISRIAAQRSVQLEHRENHFPADRINDELPARPWAAPDEGAWEFVAGRDTPLHGVVQQISKKAKLLELSEA